MRDVTQLEAAIDATHLPAELQAVRASGSLYRYDLGAARTNRRGRRTGAHQVALPETAAGRRRIQDHLAQSGPPLLDCDRLGAPPGRGSDLDAWLAEHLESTQGSE